MLVPKESKLRSYSKALCEEFLFGAKRKKYVLGRNVYSKKIIKKIKVDGIIDDFTEEKSFYGVPIFKSFSIPKNSLVLNAAGGRPFSAQKQLQVQGLESIDYFSFLRLGIPGFPELVFNEGFRNEFKKNKIQYDETMDRLADLKSKETFKKLVYFRFTLDLKYLSGFKEAQKWQYFEPFLDLKQSGETFIDVGGFDGKTSIEFAKRCPKYRAIHIFEPDRYNMKKCRQNLKKNKNVYYYQIGASNCEGRANVKPDNSTSRVTLNGQLSVRMSPIDKFDIANASFVKIDTEGFEMKALLGMQKMVSAQTPRLAVCIYHRAGDFWRVPKIIDKMSNKYNIYVRHYTESIYETVMYFVPRS